MEIGRWFQKRGSSEWIALARVPLLENVGSTISLAFQEQHEILKQKKQTNKQNTTSVKAHLQITVTIKAIEMLKDLKIVLINNINKST